MLPEQLTLLAQQVVQLYTFKKLRVATAESCTGGLVAASLTSIPGASAIFERGFITYSNDAKVEELGVDPSLIDEFGAVSEPVALAMAHGARSIAKADIGLSITGVAGPGGGSVDKPVGLVYIGYATEQVQKARRLMLDGYRNDIRMHATRNALEWLYTTIREGM